MTISVTHSTPADSSFSSTGATAWNADHTLTGVGTIAEQNANAVAITGGAIDGTTVGLTTPAAGTFTTLTATGQTSLGGAAGSEGLRVNTTASGTRYVAVSGSTGAGNPNIIASAGNLVVSGGSTAGVIFYSNSYGAQQMAVSHTASAVNYVQVTGAATASRPVISAQGSDVNVGLTYNAKGSANHFFQTGGLNSFSITNAASQVNWLQAAASATGIGLQFSAQGSDTNVSAVFQSKGTGAIDLAAGSSGVNISNGGTVTALTRTGAGTGYTSPPTVAITAPTTAGGVQATASVFLQLATTPTITSGGTGYTVNDVLTFVGGTIGLGATASAVTVTSVSGGVITGISINQFGTGYSTVPTNPISVTGGTGSGATFTVSGWQISAFTITNAGSGYVEQPTVSFSGGGGSGAAAYATVGSGTVVRSLGTSVGFYTPAGLQLQVNDGGGTGANYWRIQGAGTNAGVQLLANGSDTNVSALYSSKGTSGQAFYTNNFAQTQFNIAHTASAVNYVQVTGAATGSGPTLSVAGSDTNVGLAIRTKGSGFITFGQDSTNQFEIIRTASAVNRLRVTGSVAGSAPIMYAEGSDTNIDLTLTPKGTGNVRFGTYTASMALTVQGYIEIKDSGGTVRKLAVIA